MSGTGRDPRPPAGEGLPRPADGPAPNPAVAAQFEQVATLLEAQGANPFRVRAYRNGAAQVRALPVSVDTLYQDQGLEGLERLPGIGSGLARAVREFLRRGQVPLLDRLEGAHDPEVLLASVPGIGPALADRVHHQLGIVTLEDLEQAAHDGRLATVKGIGARRVATVRAALGARLGHPRLPAAPLPSPPPVGELLEVDRAYRDQAAAGRLPTIAPRRFNPGHRPWLPVLHRTDGPRHYTALYSNTARAHQLGRTHDWVVIYSDGDREEHQATVVTARGGPLVGRRIVRGREAECLQFYREQDGAHAPLPEGAEP